MMVNIVMIGPAGCGKTSLTDSFGRWLESELGEPPIYVNLDPGVLVLPYKPDYDVRSLVKVDDVMRREKLGPNGAVIRAAEIMEDNLEEILKDLQEVSGEAGFRLIDTPGQMELFLFREMGPKIIDALSRDSKTVTVYIIDPFLASTPTGIAISITMSMITKLRLNTPVISVINKSDIGGAEEIELLLTSGSKLANQIALKERGLIADLSIKFVDFVGELSKAMRIVKVSAKKGEGMTDLYNIINDALCECGDLT